VAPGSGQCELSVWSERPEQDLRELTGSLTVTAIVDLDEEKRARVAVVRQGALAVRTEVGARLVAQGADPDLRERLRAEARQRDAIERQGREEARARARYEREQATLRVRLERGEKLRLEQRRTGLALEVRGQLWAYLITHGADPELRVRLQAEAQLRAEATLRARAERARQHEEARLRAEAALMGQSRAALEARAGVLLWLTSNGAVVRPPRPEAPVETPPASASGTAVWVAGSFQWIGGQWVWSAGYWAEPPTAKAVWIAPAEVSIGGAVVVRPGGWVDGGSGRRVKIRVRSRRGE